MKTCSQCREEKSLSAFSKGKYTKDGYQYCCKICNRKYRRRNANQLRIKDRERRMRNAEQIRNGKIKAKYGITLDDVSLMKAKQGYCCAICFDSLNPPYIDHNHRSGKIRGLLCRVCNVGLGHFRDSKALLHNAITYLAKDEE